MGKNEVEAYIYWDLGEIIVWTIRNSKTWISINHIFAYLMELEGISTVDLYTKTYFYALNYIIYGVKAWINKIKNDVIWFYGTKKEGINVNIS